MINLKRKCFCGNTTGDYIGDVNFQTYENHLLPNIHCLIACKACGFVFADFKSTQAVFDEYYEFFSKYEDASLSISNKSHEKNISQENLVHFIEKRLDIHKSAHIIDIGCARGNQLKYLSNRSYQNLYGLDPSQKCIDVCNSQGFTAFKGSIAQNDIKMTFDLIIMDNVLEHVYNINDCFSSILKLLKPGGYLIVRVPDARVYTPSIYKKSFSAFTIEHINHFDHQSLIDLGRLHNLSIVSIGIDPQHPASLPIIYKKVLNQDYLNARQACKTYLAHSERILEIKQNELKGKLSNNKIVIWGIGSYYSRLAHKGFFNDFEVVALVDKDVHKQKKTIGAQTILSPNDLQKIDAPFSIVVCAENCGELILKDIEKLNLKKDVVEI